MSLSDSVIGYMIAFLCVIAFCMIFSGFVKKCLKILLRGGVGLMAISILNVFLKGFGLVLGVNAINGLLIGFLGLPAFIGLYIVRFFTL